MEHVHLIGIGGSGLSAIARLLLESGYTVTGSDRLLSPLAQELQASGVHVALGPRPLGPAGTTAIPTGRSPEHLEHLVPIPRRPR